MISFLLSFIPGFGPFVVWAGRNKALARLLDGLAMLAVMLLVMALTYHLGAVDERRRWQAKAQAEAAALAARKALADAAAVSQRSADTAAVAAQQEARSHAYASLPDSAPSDVRHALACQRLRAARPGHRVPGCE